MTPLDLNDNDRDMPEDPWAVEQPPPPQAKPEFTPVSYALETPDETVRRTGLAYSAGIVFVASVAFMLFIGWLADWVLGSSPWGIVGGIVIGSIIGFVQFFRLTSRIFGNNKPDIIFASLFCHHFTDEELIKMMAWMKANSTLGFFINDLHRHPVAYHFIKLTSRLFSSSYLVKNDAPLSVLRGFKKQDWQNILQKAGIRNYTIEWKWAFRYLVQSPLSPPASGGA